MSHELTELPHVRIIVIALGVQPLFLELFEDALHVKEALVKGAILNGVHILFVAAVARLHHLRLSGLNSANVHSLFQSIIDLCLEAILKVLCLHFELFLQQLQALFQ